LNPGYKTDRFTKLVTNLKQNGGKKKFLRAQKWGVGEEWEGDLTDSKSRMPGVKFGCTCSTSHLRSGEIITGDILSIVLHYMS